MKKNPNPIKEKEKQQILRYRKKNLITQEEYEQICRKGKLNSYFMKRVSPYNAEKFSQENYVETKTGHYIQMIEKLQICYMKLILKIKINLKANKNVVILGTPVI